MKWRQVTVEFFKSDKVPIVKRTLIVGFGKANVNVEFDEVNS